MNSSCQPNDQQLCGCCAGVQAETPEVITNRPALSAVSYRVGRYGTFYASMLAALSDSDLPALAALRTRDSSDFSIAFLDTWAVVCDILTFYQERLANESYLRCAIDDRSVMELAALVGYKPSPGVAASAYLAFSLNPAPGAPDNVTIPAGTRVQSVPGPGQTPQVFETSSAIVALIKQNQMAVETSTPWGLNGGDTSVWITGVNNNLNPGDALLFVNQAFHDQVQPPSGTSPSTGAPQADLHFVSSVQIFAQTQQTLVVWDQPLVWSTPNDDTAYIYVMRKRAALFGAQSVDPRSLTVSTTSTQSSGLTTVTGWPQSGGSAETPATQDWNFLAPFNAPAINLDASYPGLAPSKDPSAEPQWVVLVNPDVSPFFPLISAVYSVASTAETSPNAFLVTTKTTQLTLADSWWSPQGFCLNFPTDVTLDSSGNLFIADWSSNQVFQVSAGGMIALLAGNGAQSFSGDNGPAASASLNSPAAVAVNSSGEVFIADTLNNRIRMVSGGIITTVAGNGTAGYAGDGGKAVSAQLNSPSGVAVDSNNNLYIADTGNNVIRMVASGTITTVAGNGTAGFSGDGGTPTSAEMSIPSGLAVDSGGNLYIADTGNNVIRMVSGGAITTVAGNTTRGYSGDGGPAVSAWLSNPAGVAVDASGNLYIADTNNSVIREVSGGNITTIAGNGTGGFSGDNGPATFALLSNPDGVAVDASGNIVIADTLNNQIRVVSGSGIITTVAGGYLQSVVADTRDTSAYVQSSRLTPVDPPYLPTTALWQSYPVDPTLLLPVFAVNLEIIDGQQLTAGQAIAINGNRLRMRINSAGSELPVLFTPAGIGSAFDANDGQIFLIDAFPPTSDASGNPVWQVLTTTGVPGVLNTANWSITLLPADAKNDPPASEAAIISAVSTAATAADITTLQLTDTLTRAYDRATVTVNANVASATNGETTNEILGNGDATNSALEFTLRQSPLTYVSSALASGPVSSLQVWVNNLLWSEVPNFLNSGPTDRAFVTSVNADGTVNVEFGNGVTGGRPPTGSMNIRAVYRKGIGSAGNVATGQLSLPLDRPQGLKTVTNPQPASGGADPDTAADVRVSAPLQVQTFGRVVSLEDYQNFALTYPGISKALATWTWFGGARGVLLTIAGVNGAVFTQTDQTLINLTSALIANGSPYVPIQVVSYVPVLFEVGAEIQINTSEYDPTLVLAAVWQGLVNNYNFQNRQLGYGVAQSQIIQTVQQVPGVIALELDVFNRQDQAATSPLPQFLPAVSPANGLDTSASSPLPQGAELLILDPASQAGLVNSA
jgi:sugar lactone lactonase YvrE